MKSALLLLISIITTGFLTACTPSDTPGTSGKLVVVSTIGQIHDTVSQIGGDQIEAIGLMGSGVDPHLYVATESDVSKLQNADVIFYNGLFLEAQMGRILEQLASRKTVVSLGDRISPDQLLTWSDESKQYDPHIWFDMRLWMQVAVLIRDTLQEEDPENAHIYEQNAATYMAELETLHMYVSDQANLLPQERRILITAHDAFGYFGATYGFEVRGLQGISTESEAGTGDVRELANYIVENRIPAIFIESSVPVRNVEALQAAVAAQGWEVQIGGELFSDAMGDPGTPEGTYTGMVRHNIDTIVGALIQE